MSEKQNNEMLLYQVEQGSIEAFNELYQRYYSFVMHICYSVLHDYMEAEEVCHDVFLDIIRKAKLYNGSRGSVEAWIAIMAKNKSKDILRKKQRRAAIMQQRYSEAADSLSPESESIRSLEYEQLLSAVKQLPEHQQRALIATYFQNKTQQECARHWSVPLGTVKSWIRYGMQNLKKHFNAASLE